MDSELFNKEIKKEIHFLTKNLFDINKALNLYHIQSIKGVGLKKFCLEQAIKYYEGASSTSDLVIDLAKKFEDYLKSE